MDFYQKHDHTKDGGGRSFGYSQLYIDLVQQLTTCFLLMASTGWSASSSDQSLEKSPLLNAILT
jgi:hypothetical protein